MSQSPQPEVQAPKKQPVLKAIVIIMGIMIVVMTCAVVYGVYKRIAGNSTDDVTVTAEEAAKPKPSVPIAGMENQPAPAIVAVPKVIPAPVQVEQQPLPMVQSNGEPLSVKLPEGAAVEDAFAAGASLVVRTKGPEGETFYLIDPASGVVRNTVSFEK